MFITVLSYAGGVAGVAAMVALVVIAMRGDPERRAEEEARAYFDEHGRWPDDQ